jgi:hypothetical protein
MAIGGGGAAGDGADPGTLQAVRMKGANKAADTIVRQTGVMGLSLVQ